MEVRLGRYEKNSVRGVERRRGNFLRKVCRCLNGSLKARTRDGRGEEEDRAKVEWRTWTKECTFYCVYSNLMA
jgi:hypothetical protein